VGTEVDHNFPYIHLFYFICQDKKDLATNPELFVGLTQDIDKLFQIHHFTSGVSICI